MHIYIYIYIYTCSIVVCMHLIVWWHLYLHACNTHRSCTSVQQIQIRPSPYAHEACRLLLLLLLLSYYYITILLLLVPLLTTHYYYYCYYHHYNHHSHMPRGREGDQVRHGAVEDAVREPLGEEEDVEELLLRAHLVPFSSQHVFRLLCKAVFVECVCLLVLKSCCRGPTLYLSCCCVVQTCYVLVVSLCLCCMFVFLCLVCFGPPCTSAGEPLLCELRCAFFFSPASGHNSGDLLDTSSGTSWSKPSTKNMCLGGGCRTVRRVRELRLERSSYVVQCRYMLCVNYVYVCMYVCMYACR